MTTTTLIWNSYFYEASAVLNLISKLEKYTSVTFERKSPVRIEVTTKTRRKMAKLMKVLSPEASVLNLQYHVPSRDQQKRWNEWNAYHSVSALKQAYQSHQSALAQ
jgi:hypothetical protein